MFLWIIQITIISFIFIFLLHHLFHFFKSTLTVPKMKDLVNSPSKKYETIYHILSKNSQSNSDGTSLPNMNSSTTEISFLPKMDMMMSDTSNLLPAPEKNMKDELKNFLKSQMNDSKTSEPISYYDFK